MNTRRLFLLQGFGLLAVGGAASLLGKQTLLGSAAAATQETFAISHTDEQWHQILSDEQFDVLRREGTERPFTSPLNDEHRAGRFNCAGCQLPLFSSDAKFDSHTGWPSFTAPLEKAVATRTDSSFGMSRSEVHCTRCGSHLGHVFDDGPAPTGLRYCMNGVAMRFTPASSS